MILPKLRKLLLSLITLAIIWAVYSALQIWSFGRHDYAKVSDCIIVLGAAIVKDQPSLVFAERINHAVTLFQQGKAPSIIFTGGLGNGELHAESEVGAVFALSKGVPNPAI